MPYSRFITLAIHTYPHAVHLRKMLESHGVQARLENIGGLKLPVSVGVRVKIDPKDLPLALRIVESGDGYAQAVIERKMAGLSGNVLIPVDFSEYSDIAVKVGFALARRLSLHPVILHTFVSPLFSGALGMAESADVIQAEIATDEEMTEVQTASRLEREANRRMEKFVGQIKSRIEEGTLPDLTFSTLVEEGLPEEVILEYSRETPPALIVMATRGKNRKEEELVGSVTAEVLDSCRVPVFAVPENYRFSSIQAIRNLLFFCNLNQNDLLSIDSLMRMFSYPQVHVTLVPVNDRAGSAIREKVEALAGYLRDNYPAATFSTQVFGSKNFRNDMEAYIASESPELLVVPNKKKNIFSRLFNPGIAHKLLFERDLPLLALPV